MLCNIRFAASSDNAKYRIINFSTIYVVPSPIFFYESYSVPWTIINITFWVITTTCSCVIIHVPNINNAHDQENGRVNEEGYFQKSDILPVKWMHYVDSLHKR